MPMTETQFNQANNVLFRAKVIHSGGWNVTLSEGGYNIGQADVIDLNNNGQADWANEPSPPYHSIVMYTEPALTVPFANIVNEANALKQGTVFTTPELTSLMVEDFGVNFGNTAFQQDQLIHQNVRSLGAVAAQMFPLGVNNLGIALDTATSEFLVYQPK